MKRSLAFVLIGLVFILSACASNSAATDTPTPTPESLLITVTPTPFATPAPGQHQKGAVAFSVDGNFLTASQDLELSAKGASKIYYSLDGSIPDASSTEYTKAISLRASSQTKAYCVTARALYADGTWSEPVVRTYFLGRNAEDRYDCLVVSITTDPDNLWDYETGIFVPGKIMDDYLKTHPHTQVDGSTPANYNALRGMEGERKANLEIYLPDGSVIVDQTCGIRCYGGWSRASDMKSVKLLARKEYGTSKFNYPFFTTALDENEEVVDVFKRLVVRACGNDNGFAFIREELFQSLAMKAGYLGKSVRPCAVYINGEYFGAYWFSEVWHKSYFENHFGKYEGTLEILEGNELKKSSEDEESQYAVDEYNEMYEKYAYADLADDATYNELAELVDIKNYLEYYAFRVFIGDNDWPTNNYKCYRYYAAEGEDYREAPFDGKWRYLIHDTDFSSGIYEDKYTSRGYSWILGSCDGVKEDLAPLFGHLMQRADCKEIFITKMLELINGIFAEDYFNAALDEMNAIRANEQHYSYTSGKIADWVREDQLEDRLERLKKWIKNRAGLMLNQTYRFFKLQGQTYNLTVTVPEGAEVSVGNWVVTEDFSGTYYSCYDLKLTALGGSNGKIVGWTVNGARTDGEELVINTSTTTENKITVEPIFEK